MFCLTGVGFLWLPGQWPRWRPRLAFSCPPPSACTCSGLVPLGHQSQPVIGADHRRERHGRAGNRGNKQGTAKSLPPHPPRKGTGGFRQRGRLRETQERQGGVGGGAGACILASSSAAGLGETTVSLSKLTPFPQRPGPPPPAIRPSKLCPSSPGPAGSGALSRTAT